MSDEDALASAIIERTNEKPFNTTLEAEVHYNHYGSRGVVDLVATNKREPTESEIEYYSSENPLIPEGVIESDLTSRNIVVYELKSSAAVSQATGANEIIRQFKRHKKYFFEGSDYNQHQYDNIEFSLVFYYDEDNYKHVASNEALYQNLKQEPKTTMLFDHPNSNHPIVVFGGDGDLLVRDNLEQHLNLNQ